MRGFPKRTQSEARMGGATSGSPQPTAPDSPGRAEGLQADMLLCLCCADYPICNLEEQTCGASGSFATVPIGHKTASVKAWARGAGSVAASTKAAAARSAPAVAEE